MKVLSLKEPYASLIKDGYKCYETRSFKTNYRGELYIHASLSKDYKDNELSKLINPMYGEIICKCWLVDCIYMTDEFIENVKKNNEWNINVVYMRLAVMLGFWRVLRPFNLLKLRGNWEYGILNMKKTSRKIPAF